MSAPLAAARMSDPHDPELRTLTEGSDHVGTQPAGVRLIFLGSAERGFDGAGTAYWSESARVIRFGRTRQARFDINDAQIATVGIPLPWVSTRHAELGLRTSEGLEFALRDLGSRNGTHIEGRTVRGTEGLEPGEIFELGRSFWMIRRSLREEPGAPQAPLGADLRSVNPELLATHHKLARIAPSAISILLSGETGTGKRVTAEAVHEASGRPGPFVAVNLAAISDADLDDALTGPEGVFARARGGTLFFDELAHLSATAQSKLVAALDRTGLGDLRGRRASSVEAPPQTPDGGPSRPRLITAVLHEPHLGGDGQIRDELLARLSGFRARLPPLRERREDLGLVCRAILGEDVSIATAAFRYVLGHRWPFNLRELRQVLGTARLLAGSTRRITPELIGDLLLRRADAPPSSDGLLGLRNRIVRALVELGGSTEAAAEALELRAADLHRWMERFDLQPEDFRRGGTH